MSFEQDDAAGPLLDSSDYSPSSGAFGSGFFLPVSAGKGSLYELSVGNPQKQTDKNPPYVAYTVKVKKLRDGVETSSFRRYSDFLWLRSRLSAAHPACVVPPMPEKALTGKFTPALLHYRARELTRFIQRVAAHPVLSADDDFDFFLTAPWDDFAAKRDAEPGPSAASTASTAFVSFIRQKAADLPLPTSSSSSSASADPDPWFATATQDLANRRAALQHAVEGAKRAVEQWRALSALFAAEGALLTAAARSDALGTPFEVTGKAAAAAGAAEAAVQAAESLAAELEAGAVGTAEDCLREIAAAQEVLTRRSGLAKALASAEKEAGKSAGKAGGAAALAARDEASMKFDEFSKEARTELERLFSGREEELKNVLVGLAKVERSAMKEMAGVWADALGKMKGETREEERTKKEKPIIDRPKDRVEVEEEEGALAGVEREEIGESGSAFASPYAMDDE